MQMLKCCLNPKVIIGLAIVGAGIVLLAPNLVAGGLPLLLTLVCPISMLVMLGSMAKMGGAPKAAPGQGTATGVAATADAALDESAVSPIARLAVLEAQLQVLEHERARLAAELSREATEPDRARTSV